LLASLIRARLVRGSPGVAPVHDAHTTDVLGRLGISLEEDSGSSP
jgi:hypothetical protein